MLKNKIEYKGNYQTMTWKIKSPNLTKCCNKINKDNNLRMNFNFKFRASYHQIKNIIKILN
jgi:hypothetical protein